MIQVHYVYGDYGLESQCELYAGNTRAESERWAQGYTRQGNFGGYSIITVGYFLENGEFVDSLNLEDPSLTE